ncbi:MAG: envelope biogenesis factor ElyC [bacterium]
MFLFKKIVSRFFFPIPLTLIISFLGLYFLWRSEKQKVGKILVTIGICMLTVLSFSPISSRLLKPLEYRYKAYDGKNPEKIFRFIVVLGGGHACDPAIPITSQINNQTLARLIEGIRIYRQNPGSKLILSGGGRITTEAEIMKEVAIILGITEHDIILESASQDTKDQARFIESIVREEHFVLVTSASHMPRSMALFRKRGMNPVPAPTNHKVRETSGFDFYFLFPSTGALESSEGAFYEYLGLVWAKLRGQI